MKTNMFDIPLNGKCVKKQGLMTRDYQIKL